MTKRMGMVLAGMVAWGAAAFGVEPVADWTMVHKRNGGILNLGTAGTAGDLALTTGAALSDDVPTVNTGGTALQLASDGTTAAAESADAFDPLAGADAFTIMGWVRRESASRSANQSARIFSDVDSSGTVAAGVEFRFAESAGRLALRVNGTEVTATTVSIPPDNGTWHHVAVVYDGRRGATNYASRNVHFYLDGIQKGYGNIMQGLAAASNAVPATVGNSSANRTADNMMAGSLDDVLVFAGWAPEPSGNNNLNLAIRDWMLRDDAGVEPEEDDEEEEGGGDSGGGGEDGEEEEVNKEIPPATLEDVVVQLLGSERQYETLRQGLIFIDAATGELYYTNEEHPEGRTVCVCKPFPDWHSFSNTVRVNGHVIALNPHYSIQAESHVLSIRYGTNTVWGILGDESGELAGLTAAMVDEGHMTISANVPAGGNPVLMVCTNLLGTDPWKPATNAVVYSQTDQATTWYVTLMEFDGTSGAEFYRVYGSGITRPAGVYCNEPLRANRGVVIPEGEGITLGTNTWTAWPTNHATAEDLNAASNAISSRVGALEEGAAEYWCKWTSGASLSSNTTYWIPTDWPARTVYCHVYCNLQGVVIMFPNWTPTQACTLHLVVNKTADGGISLKTENGSGLQTMTSSSAIIRDVVFRFIPSVGWVTFYYTLGANSHVISGDARSSIQASILPEGGDFAPSTNNPIVQTLSLPPVLSPSVVLQTEEELEEDSLPEQSWPWAAQAVSLEPATPGDLGIDDDLTVREGMEATIALTANAPLKEEP